jgi:hypothetical protein
MVRLPTPILEAAEGKFQRPTLLVKSNSISWKQNQATKFQKFVSYNDAFNAGQKMSLEVKVADPNRMLDLIRTSKYTIREITSLKLWIPFLRPGAEVRTVSAAWVRALDRLSEIAENIETLEICWFGDELSDNIPFVVALAKVKVQKILRIRGTYAGPFLRYLHNKKMGTSISIRIARGSQRKEFDHAKKLIKAYEKKIAHLDAWYQSIVNEIEVEEYPVGETSIEEDDEVALIRDTSMEMSDEMEEEEEEDKPEKKESNHSMWSCSFGVRF